MRHGKIVCRRIISMDVILFWPSGNNDKLEFLLF